MRKMENSYKYLIEGTKKSPKKECLVLGGIVYTYADLFEIVAKKAFFFKENGVSQGSKVALYSDNYLDVISSIFGIWSLDATVIPMNVIQKEDKLQLIEELVNPDIGFYSKEYEVNYLRNFELKEIQIGDESLKLVQTVNNLEALILFTSGSSGVPKGVPISHEALYHNTISTARRLGLKEDDKIFINTPPYTTSSLVHVLTLMSHGGCIVMEKGFMFGASLLGQIVKHNCTGFGGVPVHFKRIVAGYAKDLDLGRLRFLMNSGDHLPISVINSIRELFPALKIYCAYGLTEVGGRLCILSPEDVDAKKGSVGRPLDQMEITIRDEHGHDLGLNKLGEVYVDGKCLMDGYLNNEEVNKVEMTAFGFKTGDIGRLDEDGCLFLQGRKDDIIKVGGEKVSVKMIEDVIFSFEDFKEFMVVPFQDKHIGRVPCLYYVLNEGVDFNRGKLLKYLRQKLPQNHIPTKFVETEKIKRTASGKSIRKVQL